MDERKSYSPKFIRNANSVKRILVVPFFTENRRIIPYLGDPPDMGEVC